MTHRCHRPVPARRIFAALDVSYPTRESDGEPHCGEMLDLRQLRIDQARQDALRYLALARMARFDPKWPVYMNRAAQARAMFAGLKRSGGRVDWRGEPVNDGGQR
jgi:hypothetical protein